MGTDQLIIKTKMCTTADGAPAAVAYTDQGHRLEWPVGSSDLMDLEEQVVDLLASCRWSAYSLTQLSKHTWLVVRANYANI